MLKFPPIKYKPIPQRLIYKNGDRYTMFSTNDGKKLGNMIVEERFYGKRKDEKYEFYPKKENYISLYITALHSLVKRQGVGRAFIKFAKHLANNERCQNRITLVAINNQEKNILDAPSPFYRKCGFLSTEKPALDDVDRVLRGMKPKNGSWYCCMPMYMPINK